MRTVHQWLAEYSVSHQNPVNKRIHWTAIPLIVLSVFGLISQIPGFPINVYGGWALAAAIFMVAYYTLLSVKLAIGAALVLGTLVVIVGQINAIAGSQTTALIIFVAIFVGAWIVQFIGHEIEGKKPSFFKDVQFLMIGPLWLLADVYRRLGITYGPTGD